MGLLIESPSIAASVSAALDAVAAKDAYEVRLTDQRTLEWVTIAPDGTEANLTTEPNTTWFSRLLVKAIGVLPVEWMM
jgi:putative cardiolipin synthase